MRAGRVAGTGVGRHGAAGARAANPTTAARYAAPSASHESCGAARIAVSTAIGSNRSTAIASCPVRATPRAGVARHSAGAAGSTTLALTSSELVPLAHDRVRPVLGLREDL